MRIGMILDNEFTGDPRVTNEVQALQQAGHQVTVLCYTYGAKPEREDYYGATIVRIPVNKWLKNKAKGLNNTIINVYPIWWKTKIKRFIKDFDIEVLHVHDLWMAESAIAVAKQHPIRIVLDLHENFVYALGSYRYSTTFPGNVLISQERWRQSEIMWLDEVDDIIVVIKEARERLINLGVDDKRISVVPNYVNIKDYSVENVDLTAALVDQYQGQVVATYTGGFDHHRGLDILIKATKIVKDQVPSFHLVLVGGGSNEEELRQLVRDLELDDKVTFAGYVPHEQLPSYVSASDICMIPHLKNPHTDNTIPHKLFQYMLKSKPIVASDCNPLQRIIQDTGTGMVYRSDDPSDLASTISGLLLTDEANLMEMGRKGVRAVREKYNWSIASKTLVDLYE